ncbi:MAG: hypothetical protein NXI32_28605 [bacterium]|nr:hypothetical protein [bacterium]
MGYSRKFESEAKTTLPPCVYLRSKAIYVTGNPDPQSPEEEGSTRFDCWCNKTQHVIGPDQQVVERKACIEGRGCFQARG